MQGQGLANCNELSRTCSYYSEHAQRIQDSKYELLRICPGKAFPDEGVKRLGSKGGRSRCGTWGLGFRV